LWWSEKKGKIERRKEKRRKVMNDVKKMVVKRSKRYARKSERENQNHFI